MRDRLLLNFLPDRSLPNLAMPSGAAKVRQNYEKQNLTFVKLASRHNPNAAENVNG
ncbi:hypothetical protein QUA13_22130 [Microcoleus sp. S28C3]|uniref:hypothetical protein n=1 Tax=Microcoleus sp. S28C3 TaxID=3055414 RepID=UPI002FD17223